MRVEKEEESEAGTTVNGKMGNKPIFPFYRKNSILPLLLSCDATSPFRRFIYIFLLFS